MLSFDEFKHFTIRMRLKHRYRFDKIKEKRYGYYSSYIKSIGVFIWFYCNWIYIDENQCNSKAFL